MITPKEFLATELKMGIGFNNKDFVNLCDHTVSQLKIDFNTVLDFGAGTGVYSEAYRKQGYKVYAFEIWKEHREYIKQNAPLVEIIDKPITTDLMNFIEVAEHMTDTELNSLFKLIKPKYILFSSTSQKTDWDESWGHINVKEQSEWVMFYKSINYNLIQELQYPTTYTKIFQYAK